MSKQSEVLDTAFLRTSNPKPHDVKKYVGALNKRSPADSLSTDLTDLSLNHMRCERALLQSFIAICYLKVTSELCTEAPRRRH